MVDLYPRPILNGHPWVPPPGCPICGIFLGSNHKVFADHFSSWHQLTSCSLVIARNMFMGPTAYEEITLVLRDFEKDRRMLKEMHKKYDEREQEMLCLLDLLKSTNPSMHEDSEKVSEPCSSVFEQLSSAIKRREVKRSSLLQEKRETDQLNKEIDDLKEQNRKSNCENNSCFKNMELKTLKEKVSELESKLEQQITSTTSKQMEFMDIRSNNFEIQAKLVNLEGELFKVNKEKSKINYRKQKLEKDNENLNTQLDALQMNSVNLRKTLEETFKNTLSITAETDIFLSDKDRQDENYSTSNSIETINGNSVDDNIYIKEEVSESPKNNSGVQQPGRGKGLLDSLFENTLFKREFNMEKVENEKKSGSLFGPTGSKEYKNRTSK